MLKTHCLLIVNYLIKPQLLVVFGWWRVVV